MARERPYKVVGRRFARHSLKRSVIRLVIRLCHSRATRSGAPRNTPRVRMTGWSKLMSCGSQSGGSGSWRGLEETPIRKPWVLAPHEFFAPEPRS